MTPEELTKQCMALQKECDIVTDHYHTSRIHTNLRTENLHEL